MTISVGSQLPAAPKSVWESGPEDSVTIPTKGKVVLLGVPGAFTPPCSSQVPGYVLQYDDFVSKGVSDIYVIAVNDVFVTKAWKETLGKGSKIHFISDSTGAFIKALGLEFDGTGLLGGIRSQRFAAIVEDGVVKQLFVENAAPDVTVTSADSLLKVL